MQILTFDDPEWLTTFPCRVAPLFDEWLTGLLLRCDEVNHWESGTTFWLIATRSTPKDKQLWKSHLKAKYFWKFDLPSFFLPHQVNITTLARYLGLSEQLCISTTYAEELIRCYNLASPPSRLLYPYFFLSCLPSMSGRKTIASANIPLTMFEILSTSSGGLAENLYVWKNGSILSIDLPRHLSARRVS